MYGHGRGEHTAIVTSQPGCLPGSGGLPAAMLRRGLLQTQGSMQLCCCAGSGSAGAAIFVGNLPNDIREREVEDLFIKVKGHSVSQLGIPSAWWCALSPSDCSDGSALPSACAEHACPLISWPSKAWAEQFHVCLQYGRVRSIDLKTPPRPPAFAFVEFDDAR